MKILLGWATALLCCAAFAPAGADDALSVRRFMLAAGANNGGPERVTLQYAISDAQAVARVFQELGGVEAADQIILRDPDRQMLMTGLEELAERAKAAKPQHTRVELIIYYSGHSDEQGLLLGNERLSYADLRRAIDQLPAEVRMVILDSCSSGTLTRLKGGQRKLPFLMDASSDVQGHVFLTSASDDEAAQESDRIGASFFTHSLVSGLRGAADATPDNRITLNEAYQFAFYETLSRTEGTQSGAQHPAYDIQMSGAGDLVMTDLRGTSAGLVLGESLAGRLRVRDAEDVLVVELMKPQGRSVELGLEPGEYRVILDRDGRFYGTAVTLVDGERTAVGEAELAFVASELTAARGPRLPRKTPPPWDGFPWLPSRQAKDGYAYPRLSVSLWPGLSTSSPDEDRTISNVSLNLTVGRSAGVWGFEWGYIGNWDLEDVVGLQIGHFMNLVEGNVEGVQITGGVNRINENLRHIQFAGLVNSTGGMMDGLQIAGWANHLQGAGRYLQIGGLVNVANGTFQGVQVASSINLIRRDCAAWQVSSLANIAMADLDGVQISAGLNRTERLHGCQIGLINVAQDAEGSQIGLVNIGRKVHGTQVGLLNCSQEIEGAPIGPLNLVRDGRHALAFWTTDTAAGHFGLKLGNPYFHSILSYGSESFGNNDRQFFGFGLGINHAMERFYAEADLMVYHVVEDAHWRDEINMLNKARLGLGWRVRPHFSIFGGITANLLISKEEPDENFGEQTWHSEYDEEAEVWVKSWPGVMLGIQAF